MTAQTPGRQELRRRLTEVRRALRELPRCRLAHLPTPLDRCPRLTDELDGPEIFVKRDDATGLAFGGNKTRQLEYVLGEALAGGADCIIQGASAQSNHARQLAAAAAKLGFTAHLMPRQDAHSRPVQGNYLLDHLLGAELHPVAPGVSMIQAKHELARRLRQEGHQPFVVGMGARRSLVLAAVAYIGCVLEIVEQSLHAGQDPPGWLYTTSQGGTQAGLVAGVRLLGLKTRVVGINPVPPDHEAYQPPAEMAGLARDAARAVGFDTGTEAGDVENRVEFVGPGYGVPSAAGREALQLLATQEGILLDPVYTSKGFAGLVHDIRQNRLTADASAVFLHTGGTPALFAYADRLL